MQAAQVLREETPKEGGVNPIRGPDTALQQYATAPHKEQVILTYFPAAGRMAVLNGMQG
jgi:hypothetical protein